MAEWLKERKVESVAMESTGVYWIAPLEVLERHGFEVLLVDTRQLARVPGRKKSDRGLRMDPTAAQLRVVDGLVPADRNRSACCGHWCGTREPGGGGRRLVAADAEEPGPDECAGAPGGHEHRWGDGNGHPASDRRGRARPAEVGEIARSALPQERGGDRRAVERALAGRSFVQPAEALKMYDGIPGADRRLMTGRFCGSWRRWSGRNAVDKRRRS